MSNSVLIIDDQPSIRKGMDLVLRDRFQIQIAENGSSGLEIMQTQQPDVVLLDIGLPDLDGISVLKKIKESWPDTAVIMITAMDEVKTVVSAIKAGAFDYLVKPLDQQELLVTVHNAMENKRLKAQLLAIQRPISERYQLDLIGRSPAMLQVVETARKAALSPDTSVLIVGESGVGKGMLARALHYQAGDQAGPFVLVNCGAIAKDLVESELFGYERGAFTGAKADGKKGRFEEAAGGSLFLDEIGAMPMEAQSKLLQVLEDRIFYRVGGTRAMALNARIISATNLDLEKAVAQGLFRSDLYYRLNVVKLEIPPLRQRPGDIPPLTQHFMAHYNTKFNKQFNSVSPEAERLLLRYDWPGNVRELRNLLERIILLEESHLILPEHLPFAAALEDPEKDSPFSMNGVHHRHRQATEDVLREALSRSGGNITEAAKLLNIPVHKLRYLLKKHKAGFLSLPQDPDGPRQA